MRDWLKTHSGWLVIAGLGALGILVAIFWPSRSTLGLGLKDSMRLEREVIEARREAARIQAASDVETAKTHILLKYQRELARLDAHERARVEDLSQHPQDLAEAAIRALHRKS